MTTDEVATTPPEGRSDPSATVAHPFGKPLPPDPETLSDAFGLLLREALARRGWVLVPMLLYVLTACLTDARRALQGPGSGAAIAAFVVADGLTLLRGSRGTRLALTAVLAAVVILCVDASAVQFEAVQFLPFVGLLLFPLVPWRHSRVAAVVATLLATAALALAAKHGPLPNDLATPEWWPWSAAVAACCGVLFATRSRTRLLAAAAVVLPPVSHAILEDPQDGVALLTALVGVHLLGLAERTPARGSRDAYGCVAAMVHRLPAPATFAAALVMTLLLMEPVTRGPWTDMQFVVPMLSGRAELAEALVVGAALGLGTGVTLLSLPRTTTFGRLAALPALAFGLTLGFVVARAGWFAELSGVKHGVTDTLAEILLYLPTFVLPAVVGLALALWLRRAHAAALAVALGALIWIDSTLGDPPTPWRYFVGAGALAGGGTTLIAWGASSKSSRTSLYLFCGLGATAALCVLTGWDAWTSKPPRFGMEVYEFIAKRLGEFAVEALGLGLATVLFVDCLRLARTVFTTCPVPETHVVRTDFAPSGRDGVA